MGKKHRNAKHLKRMALAGKKAKPLRKKRYNASIVYGFSNRYVPRTTTFVPPRISMW